MHWTLFNNLFLGSWQKTCDCEKGCSIPTRPSLLHLYWLPVPPYFISITKRPCHVAMGGMRKGRPSITQRNLQCVVLIYAKTYRDYLRHARSPLLLAASPKQPTIDGKGRFSSGGHELAYTVSDAHRPAGPRFANRHLRVEVILQSLTAVKKPTISVYEYVNGLSWLVFEIPYLKR